jgi:hypothetical protein
METMEITRRTGDYYGDGSDNHIWEITDADGIAAELYVSTGSHEIMNIWTREDRRGEGLARALYETAATQTDIYHAPEAHRTDEGNHFANAVGGPTIAPYPCTCHACTHQDDED